MVPFALKFHDILFFTKMAKSKLILLLILYNRVHFLKMSSTFISVGLLEVMNRATEYGANWKKKYTEEKVKVRVFYQLRQSRPKQNPK
jgi:hypothetical protein